MPRITVRGPWKTGEQVRDLGQDGKVLCGRAPALEKLTDPDGGAPAPILHTPGVSPTSTWLEVVLGEPPTLTLREPSVSANHLLAWTRDGNVYLRDLGSRNGTWLLLPRAETLCAGKGDVVVHLAAPDAEHEGADEPPAAQWSGPREFARAIASSLEQWPNSTGFDLDVRVLDSEQVGTESAIPLASGDTLVLIPRETAHLGFSHFVERVWRWVDRQNSTFRAEQRTREEGLILASPALRAAHRQVVEAARSDAGTLLLMGPSGAGKEMLAEVFHRHSGRSGPFIALNCALFNKELLRSELFGAEVGAFSGASRRIVGAVERAQGGTLFLDEIGELPGDVQPMLLRFLDRHTYEPLGHYGKPQRADVSVVVATNRDLRLAAREGKFRHDLWYRLSVHVVAIPGLDSRWPDIVAYLAEASLPGSSTSLLDLMSTEALEVLRAHSWEGNFRELANFRERAMRGGRSAVIDAASCRRLLAEGSLKPVPTEPVAPASAGDADFSALATRALSAFQADHGRAPSCWDDQKEWNEKYLKPLLFHRLAAVDAEEDPLDEKAVSALASRAASRARADRGTAIKQLTRYFQRFRG